MNTRAWYHMVDPRAYMHNVGLGFCILINTYSGMPLGTLPPKLVSLMQVSLMNVRLGPFDKWVCSGDAA